MTRLAVPEVPKVVTLTPTGMVRPVADGAGTLRFSLGDQSVTIPVKVSGQRRRIRSVLSAT